METKDEVEQKIEDAWAKGVVVDQETEQKQQLLGIAAQLSSQRTITIDPIEAQDPAIDSPDKQSRERTHLKREASNAEFRKAEAKKPSEHRRALSGGREVKAVTLVLVLPKGRRITKTFRSGAGKVWTVEGVDGLLDKMASALEKDFPGIDFRMVELAENRHFNMIHPGAEKGADVKAKAAVAQ